MAEGRLLHVERRCGARKAAGVGSQNGIAELAKFDRHAVIAPARYLSDIEAQFDADRNIDFALEASTVSILVIVLISTGSIGCSSALISAESSIREWWKIAALAVRAGLRAGAVVDCLFRIATNLIR